MSYSEEDYLLLSGLQHFAFCRRQWALIHIEEQWAENVRTTEGHIIHERAHDTSLREKRGDTLIVRGVSVSSRTLGISGQCDVLEYHKDEQGVPIKGEPGNWRPYPIEYKRGLSKENDADRLQLCAQAMCLEEMLCCEIPEGAIFYGESRHREIVPFTETLRQKVKNNVEEMHALYKRAYTPKVKASKACNACSLKELCLPKLVSIVSVDTYMDRAMKDSL